MAAISNIINVTVNVTKAAPSRAAFGIPLIVPPLHTTFAERVRSYSSLSGLLDDGFEVYDAAYIWAAALFSQNPRPSKVKIGRIDAGDADLTESLNAIEAADSKWYALLIPDTFNAAVATERAAVLAGAAWAQTKRVLYLAESGAANIIAAGDTLASALKAGGYSRTSLWYHAVQPQVLTLTMDAALVALNSIAGNVNGNALAPTVFAADSDTTLATLATTIQAEAAVDTAVVTTIPAAVDNDRAIVITAADPWTEIKLDGFLTTLGASQNSWSVVETTPASKPLSASIAGRCLSKDPGSLTWANQANLAAIEADDLSQTQIDVLELQRANYYAPFTDDLKFTRQGTTADTYYIDQLRGLDALITDLEDALLALFANTDKVPKTDDGKEIVRKELVSVLVRFKRAGFLTGDVEQAVDMSASSYAARTLTGMVIDVEGAGALHGVNLVINFKE